MTQRFCEVDCEISGSPWIQIFVYDDAGAADDNVVYEPQACAGGKVFYNRQEEPFMIKWRCHGETLDVMVESLHGTIDTCYFRITCSSSDIVGEPHVQYQEDELSVAFSSQFAVHQIKLDVPRLGVKSSESFPLTSLSPVKNCSIGRSNVDGVVFSLVCEDGRILAVILEDDSTYREVQLKQASLMNALWNRVRRSISSNADSGEQAVGSAVFLDAHSVYFLTKNLHLQRWSTDSWQCVSDRNLLSNITAGSQVRGLSLKSLYSNGERILGVQVSDGRWTKILLLKLENGEVNPNVAVIDCCQNDVITFDILSEKLFVLWKDFNGCFSLQHLPSLSGTQALVQTYLKPGPPVQLDVNAADDPRDAYCSVIFKSNCFNLEALRKTICVLDPQLSPLVNDGSVTDLRRWTCDAIAKEVYSLVHKDEVTNAEFRELQLQTWHKFYSNLIQYQEVHMEPLGLVDGRGSMPIALIRKSATSYLRVCDSLEQQVLFPSDPLDESQSLDQDVVSLSQMLDLLQSALADFQDHIYTAFINGQPLSDTIREIVLSLVNSDDHSQFKGKLVAFLHNTTMLRESIVMMQTFLNVTGSLEQHQPHIIYAEVSTDSNPFLAMSHAGRDYVCTAVRDVVRARYNLCCAVAVFLDYSLLPTDEVGGTMGAATTLEELSDSFLTLLRSYAVLLWMSDLRFSLSNRGLNPAFLDVLKASDAENVHKILSLESASTRGSSSVLDEYLCNIGGCHVQALLLPTADPRDHDDYIGMLTIATCQALWPEVNNTLFGEFLLLRNETTSLQTYCRLFDGWFKPAVSSHLFLLGSTYLLESEPMKALNAFLSALYGMFEGTSQLSDDQDMVRQSQLNFCFKVMNLLEELSYSEQVIQMAHQTIKFTSSQQATLWTKIFKHNLELKRYDEAFTAILSNPDKCHKMDCLQQLVSTLCENSELTTLASLPYKNMVTQEDFRPAVISILMNKARSVDLAHRNYYNLIYSFHVINNDMFSAANVMYECTERLSLELSGLPALQARAKCYLACITALRCVPAMSAWIIPNQSIHKANAMRSPKRTSDGDDKSLSNFKLGRLLTLDDIEKEYMLINMSLRLAKNNCTQITSGSTVLSASEIVTLLSKTGMYDEAIEVSTEYKMSLKPVFESLAFRCIHMSRESTTAAAMVTGNEDRFDWLSYNALPSGNGYSSPSEQAWNLLQQYLTKHEESSTPYHKVVATKVLANGATLPDWFTGSYKKRNVAELLRLYLQHDMIEDGAELAINFLLSLSGINFDQFGLESGLSATQSTSAVWCPYTSIDILICTLEDHKSDPYYSQILDRLRHAVNAYTTDLTSKSKDVERRLSSIRVT